MLVTFTHTLKKDVVKTWKFLSISQLVSKSSSSSPKGFISCSATFRTKCRFNSAQCSVTKGTCDHISDLKPPSVKEELQQGENGHVEVKIVTRVTLSGVQKLTTNQTDQEETVDRQCHHLSEKMRYCNWSWQSDLSLLQLSVKLMTGCWLTFNF